jgi:hypothetical protein
LKPLRVNTFYYLEKWKDKKKGVVFVPGGQLLPRGQLNP